MNYPAKDRKPLSDKEREKLANAVIGFGNTQKVAEITGVSTPTIRHAIGGFNINPDIRKKLRDYLAEIKEITA
ncbi:MAG: hypothetical protein EPN37_07050 [Chitinophagaceae bacterium]|nr:MAG: hypothetical protein EPN37_07050 [Chitinophagaceae bacterium]